MTNEEVQKMFLRNLDMQAIEEEIEDHSNRERHIAEVILTNDTPQKIRLRISNPLEEFIVEVKVT